MDGVQHRINALSSPVRREILWRVWDRELSAGVIAAAFDLSAPTISSHLRVLKDAGLVRERRAGTFRYYRADRAAVRTLQPLLDREPGRWEPADNLPERAATSTAFRSVVVVSTTLPVPAVGAFKALTDPVVFARWLGVPVSLDGGVFAAAMEWGTTVRGRYEHLVEPTFIHFTWDLAEAGTPVPGGDLAAYVHIEDLADERSYVETRQLVDDGAQARFMEAAWGVVLGRLHNGVKAALHGQPGPRRAPRRKRSEP